MADVLVVDDEASIRAIVCNALEQRGISADTASNGKEALIAICAKTVEGGKYDAIILDIAMPIMNGWQVMQALENNPLWKETRVVALTGVANSTQDRARVAEYDGLFVEKDATFPLTIGQLIERLMQNGKHCIEMK